MKLTAYVVGREFPLIRTPPGRPWMDATPSRYAYRCLPLLIANQNGWLLITPERVEALWNGGPSADDLRVECNGEVALSHFGHGIITWRIPYLFRTPEGYNLYAHGPANYPKEGLCPLEGIIETDWAVATFTFNWQVVDQARLVGWEVGEPICMVTPIRRGEVEQFEPEIRSLDSDPVLKEQYEAFQRGRDSFLSEPPTTWQRDYFQGGSPGGASASQGEHQTKLHLKDPVRV